MYWGQMVFRKTNGHPCNTCKRKPCTPAMGRCHNFHFRWHLWNTSYCSVLFGWIPAGNEVSWKQLQYNCKQNLYFVVNTFCVLPGCASFSPISVYEIQIRGGQRPLLPDHSMTTWLFLSSCTYEWKLFYLLSCVLLSFLCHMGNGGDKTEQRLQLTAPSPSGIVYTDSI